MRQLLSLPLALAALGLAGTAATAPAQAQGPGVGQLEIRAYQPIPKAKTAVQLTSDTHLSRELRRLVMIRLSKRGNDVGFSGGNVMRMDVQFRDFNFDGPPSASPPVGGRSYDQPGNNPRVETPQIPINPRPGSTTAGGSTLRITLTLYSLDGGRVLWQAVSSCKTGDSQAMVTGEMMIDAIFDDADKNRMGDAGCPL